MMGGIGGLDDLLGGGISSQPAAQVNQPAVNMGDPLADIFGGGAPISQPAAAQQQPMADPLGDIFGSGPAQPVPQQPMQSQPVIDIFGGGS